MKNKNLIITGTVVMFVIGLYLYFTVKKANAAAISGGSLPGDSASPAAPGLSTGKTTDTTSAKPATTGKSWYDWFMGVVNPIPGNSQVITSSSGSAAFPLKQGSTGAEVSNLQSWLNAHVIVSYSLLTVDGKFGPLTLTALKRTLGVSEVSEAWYNTNILKSVM